MNKHLQRAKEEKNDEFYTRYEDIEAELRHDDYEKAFFNKTIYCPCDSDESNFYLYFRENFHRLGLKCLKASSYREDGKARLIIYDGTNTFTIPLRQNGDITSREVRQTIRSSDIIVTNPPFSIFRKVLSILEEEKKEWVLLCHKTAVSYKDLFTLIKSGEVRTGYKKRESTSFTNTDKKVPCYWVTNINLTKPVDLELTKTYNECDFPVCDNTNVLYINKTIDIPFDYYGEMAVPITFLAKTPSHPFDIIKLFRPYVNGKVTFVKVLIRRKKQ